MKWLVIMGAALFVAAAACSVDHETQVTLAIASEAKIPDEVSSLQVTVTATKTNQIRFQQTYNPTDGSGFPTTLAIIPADEDSLSDPIRVDLHAQGPSIDLKRSAIVSYVEGRNLLLAMPLRMACLNFGDCPAGKSCAGGQCVEPTVASSTLPTFSEALISPTAANCFDESKCLVARTLVDVAKDCSFPLSGDPTQLNVAIRWKAAEGRVLTLDSGDAVEGWTVQGGRGLLSPGVCNSHLEQKNGDGTTVADYAEQVYVTTGCAAKTSLIPYCKQAGAQVGVGASAPP